MDRRELREFLDDAGVLPAVYNLDGRSIEDGLTLDSSAGTYKVLYTERGQSSTLCEFTSEDEACRYLADELLRYEPYRFAVAASSPHHGVSAQEYLGHWLGANGLTPSDITDDDFRIAFIPGRSGDPVIRLSIRRTFLRTRGLDR